MWITTDSIFTGEGSPAVLRIQSYQLPEELVGAIYLTGPSGESTPLIPDENGNLIPGLSVPLSEFFDREIYLANSASGSLQFRGAPASDEPPGDQDPSAVWESNLITLSAFEQAGSITGNLSGRRDRGTGLWNTGFSVFYDRRNIS